jgi:hypothetical protein
VKTVGDVLMKIKGNMKFQKIYVFLLIVVFIAGNRFLTMYPFMQLYPDLMCLKEDGVTRYECKQKVACNDENKETFKMDVDGEFTLNNWMTRLDLICVDRYEIGL